MAHPSVRIVTGFWVAFYIACNSQDRPCDSWGQACGSDSECACGLCVANADQTARDLKTLALVCNRERDGGRIGDRCQGGNECRRGICLVAGTCALACNDDNDCGPLERCALAYASASEASSLSLRACVSIVDLRTQAEVKSEVKPEFFKQTFASASLDLPGITRTSFFVLEHLGSNAWPAFTACRSPICIDLLRTRDEEPVVLFERDLYSRTWKENDQPALNPVDTGNAATGSQSHPVAIMLPNGPRSVLSDSGFNLTLTAEKAGDIRVTELSAPRSGELLDLNLFYLGGHDWAPEGERGPLLVSDALVRFDELYAQAGIRIGEVRQIAVKGGVRTRFETIAMRYGVLENLPPLLALSAGVGNSAINLFFVREIEGRNGPTLAISGGIPGPLGMQGTGASGIAINADAFDDSKVLGGVIAHEVGHFLGLFHTSESNGTVLDPLPDTPECRMERDKDGSGSLSVDECQGFGADNLMFWVMNSGTTITSEQAAVLQSAIILH